jgi:hypothetical protein
VYAVLSAIKDLNFSKVFKQTKKPKSTNLKKNAGLQIGQKFQFLS